MMFDKFCIEKILAGEKTVTRRIKRNERRPAIPGHIHKLKVDRTKNTFGTIEIIDCKPELLYRGSISRIEARREGFSGPNEYFEYFNKINNMKLKRNHYLFVWRIEFRLKLEKCEDCDKFYDCDNDFSINQLVKCYSE